MKDTSVSRRAFRRSAIMCVVVAMLGLGEVTLAPSAGASVVLAGTSWYGGAGVPVCYSATAACPGVTRVGGWPGPDGVWGTGDDAPWQCVELAQRFYKAQGWYGGIFAGVNYAYQIYDNASALGFTRQQQGAISSVVAGDMIIENPANGNGSAGHVAVVDYVSGSSIYTVEENASSTGRHTYTLSGTSVLNGYATVRGVVHSPNNHNSNGGSRRPSVGDYNGDGKTDFGVYDPSTGEWNIKDVIRIPTFGDPTWFPVPGDYNGDGKTDFGVYNPTSGEWNIKDVALVQGFGGPNWVPVPADYNGDGKTDFGVYNSTNGEWNIKDVVHIPTFGGPGWVPVPGDYNGDGKTDFAVYNVFNGEWNVKDVVLVQGFGGPTWVPVPGDYNGDGKTDFGVYSPSNGEWNIKDVVHIPTFGDPAWVPVPGDYNGDGKTDFAVYNPSNGEWNVKDVVLVQGFGGPNWIPVASQASYRAFLLTRHGTPGTVQPGTVTGSVVTGGAPVDRAMVRLYDPNRASPVSVSTTGSNGAWSAKVPPGLYLIEVVPPGGASRRIWFGGAARGNAVHAMVYPGNTWATGPIVVPAR